MSRRARLTVSVDAHLVASAQAAVAAGQARSVSAWVNDVLRSQSEHRRRLAALDSFIATFEAQHGEISGLEMNEAGR